MKFRKYVHAPYKPSTPPPSASTKKANNSPSNSSSKGASPSEPWPDNSKEYQVLDGGSNYFQFHCDMKAREVFFAYVHGEA